ncbi:VgrG-related protein [Streptomyces sp. FL07-04A]|uniref:VgrG-related protein n=1 Tax=Streptomyces sp. FL07-04A TaxID=3028658 RepID=UPI0029A6DF1E|nr:VgrG-related protein [Streptomyces sp. FL07-04A]MDX3575426.1 VgrG-related protein [Streptomyces sp. FL07-04A]
MTTMFVVEAPRPLPASLADLPVHVRIEDGNAAPAAAVLRYRDPERIFLRRSGIVIGGVLRVSARPGGAGPAVPLFDGEVVALEAEFDGTGTFTTVRAFDHGHRLQRGRRVAAYPNMTASDIAHKVATRAGIAIGRIDPTTTTCPLVTQPNVSDWDFLASLAAENGREMLVEGGKFHFRRPNAARSAPPTGGPAARRKSPYVIRMAEDVLSVRSSITSVNQVERVQVHGWSVQEKKALLGETTVGESRTSAVGVTPRQAAGAFGAAPLVVADVPYRSDAEVKAVSRALADDVSAALAELEVVVRGDPRLRCGAAVTLTGAGVPFDGRYTVTASRHLDRPGLGYETWLTVSGRQDRTAYGVVGGASAAARSPRIPGVAVGVVTDAKEPKDREGQGWVRLRFPWLSGDSGTAYVSDWVRTVQAGGVGGGGVFSPDVNDEVLVAFEQGLLDRPYVIGGLYNGVDKPSPHDTPLVDATSGKVNRRSLASRAGDRLELLDAAGGGPGGVRVRTGDGKLELHLDRRQTAITVHSDGTVSITAAEHVTVAGKGITLDARSGALELKGASVSVAGSTVSLKGDSECVVKAPIVKIN